MQVGSTLTSSRRQGNYPLATPRGDTSNRGLQQKKPPGCRCGGESQERARRPSLCL